MAVAIAVDFKWPNPCKTCILKGSWDNWMGETKLTVSSSSARGKLVLTPGYHEYKFIVDGQWRYHPYCRIIITRDGYVNNLLETVDFDHYIHFGYWNLENCVYDNEDGWLHSPGCNHNREIIVSDTRSISWTC